MGSTTFLDIIGSVTTFGLLLVMALRLNAGTSESSFGYTSNYLLQRNMVLLTVMLEEDLKHVGVGSNDPTGGILYADSNRLRFRADLPPQDAVVETVEWFVGLPSELPETENKNDCYVYRTVSGVTTKMNLGVTRLTFRYINIADPTLPPLPTPITAGNGGNVGPVEIFIKLESPYKMKQEYMADTSQYEMVWRQMRSISRNNSSQF